MQQPRPDCQWRDLGRPNDDLENVSRLVADLRVQRTVKLLLKIPSMGIRSERRDGLAHPSRPSQSTSGISPNCSPNFSYFLVL